MSDKSICERDIKNLKDLGVNTVRVYIADNSKSHKDCMNMLADAGIYLVVDVNNEKYSINNLSPHKSYNAAYLQNVFATVEEFAQYPNTLAFFSGNEVISDRAGTDKAAPYVKAVTRDIKNYMNSRGLRKVPVGYSAADVSQNRFQTAQYMNCGSDDMRSDFFAFNDYSFCNTDFKTAGWDVKVKTYSDYGLPIFLSEYGCIKNRPRKFEEVEALMSSEMTSVYSGGLMFEYSYETNMFGIVDVDGDTAKPRPEFQNFKASLSKNPAPKGDGGASTKAHSAPCPTMDKDWNVDPSKVPSMPKEAEKYMTDGAGKGAGLSGKGSMEDDSSGTSTTDVTSGTPSPNKGDGSDNENAASTHASLGMLPVLTTGITVLCTVFGALML